eukprot:395828-Prymnesium_polylepis.1
MDARVPPLRALVRTLAPRARRAPSVHRAGRPTGGAGGIDAGRAPMPWVASKCAAMPGSTPSLGAA